MSPAAPMQSSSNEKLKAGVQPVASPANADKQSIEPPVKLAGAIDISPASIKDWLDIGSKAVIGILAISYALGLVIVNFHLRKWGVAEYGLLHVEYVLTGVVWVFLVGLATYGVKEFLHCLYALTAGWSARKIRNFNLRVLLSRVFLLPAGLALMLGLLSEEKLSIASWKGWLAALILIAQGGSIVHFLGAVRGVSGKIQGKVSTAEIYTNIYAIWLLLDIRY